MIKEVITMIKIKGHTYRVADEQQLRLVVKHVMWGHDAGIVIDLLREKLPEAEISEVEFIPAQSFGQVQWNEPGSLECRVSGSVPADLVTYLKTFLTKRTFNVYQVETSDAGIIQGSPYRVVKTADLESTISSLHKAADTLNNVYTDDLGLSADLEAFAVLTLRDIKHMIYVVSAFLRHKRSSTTRRNFQAILDSMKTLSQLLPDTRRVAQGHTYRVADDEAYSTFVKNIRSTATQVKRQASATQKQVDLLPDVLPTAVRTLDSYTRRLKSYLAEAEEVMNKAERTAVALGRLIELSR